MDSQDFSIEISPVQTVPLVEHGCMAVLVLMLVVSVSINMDVWMSGCRFSQFLKFYFLVLRKGEVSSFI